MSEKIQLLEAWGKLGGMATLSIILGFTLYFAHKEKVVENQMQKEHNQTFEATMERQVDALEEFLNYYTGRTRVDE